MFRNSTEFAGSKAAELKEVLEEIAAEKRASTREKSTFTYLDEMLMTVPTEPLDLWIDKVCGVGGRWRFHFPLAYAGLIFTLFVPACPDLVWCRRYT